MSFDNEDPDISRVFAQKVDRRFQRDFGRFIPHLHQHERESKNEAGNEMRRHSNILGTKNSERKYDPHLSVKLIEANETVAQLRRQLESRNEEVERLKRAEASANERVQEAQREIAQTKAEADRARRRSSLGHSTKEIEGRGIKTGDDKLLIDDYRTALVKYKTWVQFAGRQLTAMKDLLEECGGWTEPNRYKVYFAYRDVSPDVIVHENAAELANGSIMAYPLNIEDVEGISASQPRPKYHSVLTQTENVLEESLQPCEEEQFVSSAEPASSGGMSAVELRLLDCEQAIERLEIENANQHDQLIILGERARNVELLEEQKADLHLQMDILRRQNEQLIRDHEHLKTVFGGGSISRNSLEELVRNAVVHKEKNQELAAQIGQLEAQRESLTTAESRRIAQLFKQKYEREVADLRAKLNKYEPIHASDTTRILRFEECNPLDEAHDELMVRRAAASATSAAKQQNPLKRKRMDETGCDEPTVLAEEEADEGEDSQKFHELRVQLAALKSRLEQNERTSAEFQRQYQECVSLLCGYDIRLGEDGFCEVENVNSRDCVFLFQKHDVQPPAVDLLDSDSARRWKEVLENYLMRYHSVPAFLSAVTISLVESPEECGGSSRQSLHETTLVEDK